MSFKNFKPRFFYKKKKKLGFWEDELLTSTAIKILQEYLSNKKEVYLQFYQSYWKLFLMFVSTSYPRFLNKRKKKERERDKIRKGTYQKVKELHTERDFIWKDIK